MLRSGLPWFLAGLGLVALAATLAAAPRYVLLGGGSAPPVGSFLDNGSLGTSLAAEMLAQQGFPVGVGLTPPPGWRGPVVYLAAGPLNCSRRAATETAALIREALGRVARVGVIVAGPPSSCVNALLEALGAPPLTAVSRSPGVYVAVPLERGAPVLVLYAPYRVAAAPGWRIAAYAVNSGGDRVPGMLVYDPGGGLRVVYIPSPLALSNLVLRAEEEAGLDPRGQLAALIRYAAGAEAGSPVAVVQPPLLLPRPRQAGAPLQPGALLLSMLDYYRRLENHMYQSFVHNPFTAIAVGIVAAAAVYASSLARGGRGIDLAEKPPSPHSSDVAPRVEDVVLSALAALRAAGIEPSKLLEDKNNEVLLKLAELGPLRPQQIRRLLKNQLRRGTLLQRIRLLHHPSLAEAEAFARAVARLLRDGSEKHTG